MSDTQSGTPDATSAERVQQAAVVGAGQMGNGIAHVFATSGIAVTMIDVSAEALARGVETITVPGALAGWQTLLTTYGTRTLAASLQPAIRYADGGFPLTPVIAEDWVGQESILKRDSAATATFLPGGRSPKAGWPPRRRRTNAPCWLRPVPRRRS